jgi:hypothetical protein
MTLSDQKQCTMVAADTGYPRSSEYTGKKKEHRLEHMHKPEQGEAASQGECAKFEAEGASSIKRQAPQNMSAIYAHYLTP